MCELMTIASAGLGIGQQVAGYQAASAAAKGQSAYARQNAINASRAAQEQYSNISLREQQEGQATYQQLADDEIKRSQLAASAEVAAGEGGVSGNSVGHVLRDIYAQAGRNEVAANTNLAMQREYLQKEKIAAQNGAQSQINAVQKGTKPSWIPYAIGAGANLMDTFAQSRNRNRF